MTCARFHRWVLASAPLLLILIGVFGQVPPANAGSPALYGSGFVVHPQGYVVTEQRVLRVTSEILRTEETYTEVVIGETSYQAHIVAEDDASCLALLKVEAVDLPWLPLADAARLELGADVRAFGRPPAWSPDQSADMSLGMVSSVTTTDSGPRLEIDAGVGPGNAGGPFVNLHGDVVGVIGDGATPRTIAVQAVRELLDKAQVPALPEVERVQDLQNVELARQVAPAVAYVRTLIERSTLQTHVGPARVVGLIGGDVLITEGYSDDPTVKVWSTGTGKLLATYGREDDGIVSAAFCTRKGILVMARKSGQLIVVSVVEGKVLGGWPAFVRGANDGDYEPRDVDVDISTDGTTIAGYWLGRLKLWDINGRLLDGITVTSDKDNRFARCEFALSHNGRQVAYMDQDAGNQIHLYDCNLRKVTRSLPVEFKHYKLAFSPDDRWLYVQGLEQIWDLRSGEEVGLHGEERHETEISAIASDADRIVSAHIEWAGKDSAQVAIEVWERTRRIRLAPLKSDRFASQDSETHRPKSICISSDGQSVATADNSGLVRVWHLRTLEDQLPPTTVLVGHQRLTNHAHRYFLASQVVLSPQRDLVASWAQEPTGNDVANRVCVSDALTGIVRQRLESKPGLDVRYELAFSSDGARFAMAERLDPKEGGYDITVRQVATGDVVRTLSFPRQQALGVRLSAHGEQVFAWGYRAIESGAPGETGANKYEYAYRVWDVDSGEIWAPLKDQDGTELNIRSVDFAPNGHALLTVDDAGHYRLCNANTQEIVHTINLPGNTTRDSTFADDGRLVATIVEAGIVVWDLSSGQVVREFAPVPPVGQVPLDFLNRPRFSPLGDLLAAVADFEDYRQMLVVWNVRDGSVRQILPTTGATDIQDLQFSSDGQSLVAACGDCVLRTYRLGPVPRPSAVVDGYLVRAERRRAAQQYDLADADYGRVIALAPWRAATHVALADSRLRKAAQPDSAAEVLSRSLLLQAAETDLTKALELDPQNDAVYLRRASLRYDAERFADALADFDLAFLFGERSPFERIERGKCHEALAQFPAAIEDYTAAIQGWPLQIPEAVLYRGLCYVQTQQWREALADLEKVETIVPDELKERFAVSLQLAKTEAAKLQSLPTEPDDASAASDRKPAVPLVEVVPGDTCVVQLTAPEGATAFVNGKDYGTKQRFEFNGLAPGQRYVSQFRIRLGNGEALRTVPVIGGTTVHVAVAAPSQIVLCQSDGRGSFGVFGVQADGGQGRRLASASTQCTFPVLSPDGAQVAFVREPASEDAPGNELVVIDIANRIERLVLNGASSTPPVWMPDSRSLIARVREAGVNHILVVDTLTSTELQRWVGDGGSPSPDGRSLAVDRYNPAAKRQYIYLVANDGSGEKTLGEGWHAQWSPDGTQLLVVRGRGVPLLVSPTATPTNKNDGLPAPPRATQKLEYDLYIIRPDGSGERLLTRDIKLGDAVLPQWSPDGTRVAYCRGNHIYVVPANGGGERQITDYQDRKPARDVTERVTPLYFHWSPDATQVVFEKSTWQLDYREKVPLPHFLPSEIWTVNADGTGLKKVVGWAGSCNSPTWR